MMRSRMGRVSVSDFRSGESRNCRREKPKVIYIEFCLGNTFLMVGMSLSFKNGKLRVYTCTVCKKSLNALETYQCM